MKTLLARLLCAVGLHRPPTAAAALRRRGQALYLCTRCGAWFWR